MTWFRKRRNAGQDALVEEARAQAEAAHAEVDLSRRRAESVRRHVNEPRRRAAARNQFYEIIRDGIVQGYEH